MRRFWSGFRVIANCDRNIGCALVIVRREGPFRQSGFRVHAFIKLSHPEALKMQAATKSEEGIFI
jgi:hypothetical protein